MEIIVLIFNFRRLLKNICWIILVCFIKQFFKKGTQKKLVNLIYACKPDSNLKEIASIQDGNIRKARLAVYLSNSGKYGGLFSKIVPYSWDVIDLLLRILGLMYIDYLICLLMVVILLLNICN